MIVRARQFPGEPPKRGRGARSRKTTSGTYRVILRIEVSNDDILQEHDKKWLEDLRKSDYDHLASYLETELGWAERSFLRMDIESIEKIADN